ncbi:hypothetical protein T492DRAFT_496917 [Pavlovales sp. CCMP2436]|nr:hypothetical protein T492DRAFT_496917 [Pavlovales sp. CCMP2436]
MNAALRPASATFRAHYRGPRSQPSGGGPWPPRATLVMIASGRGPLSVIPPAAQPCCCPRAGSRCAGSPRPSAARAYRRRWRRSEQEGRGPRYCESGALLHVLRASGSPRWPTRAPWSSGRRAAAREMHARRRRLLSLRLSPPLLPSPGLWPSN